MAGIGMPPLLPVALDWVPNSVAVTVEEEMRRNRVPSGRVTSFHSESRSSRNPESSML